MSANRRRHANVVPLASIIIWVMICAFTGGAGLVYVSLKNDLHSGADEVKKLEREIEQVGVRITVVKGEIQKLTSVDALRRRYESDKTRLGGLTEIAQDRLVWVDRPIQVGINSTEGLQQAANQVR
jgi:hypothetical protein